MLLAFDNTDGPEGGCTTYLAFHVLLALPELALTGLPRLVRLNPNVPWKTRGNGAVCLPLGRPTGPQTKVGELLGRDILAFPDGEPVEPDEALLARAFAVLERHAQRSARPAVAASDQPPHAAAYWQAVQALVTQDEAEAGLAASHAVWRTHPSRDALAGCLGALAWPGPPSSYEFLAYRDPANWATERRLDPAPLAATERPGAPLFAGAGPRPAATFHTTDPTEGRLACVPHTPDPVLCGLRGWDANRLMDAAQRALSAAAQEPIQGWLMWATNQASGDHVADAQELGEAFPLATLRLPARVTERPSRRAGGHAWVRLQDAQGTPFAGVAFEPTKAFRDVVDGLRPGDDVTVVGAWEPVAEPGLAGVVKLEKLEVLALADAKVKLANPKCPACGRSMKSAGLGQGYRCRDCGTKAPPEAGGFAAEARTVALGWHEVPVMARRHLHRPLDTARPGHLK